jgi:glutathione S-transferase
MLTLHLAPNCLAGRIVWLFEELGLPYDINKMAFHPSELKADAHRARHPVERVPVLEDGDVSIFESGATVDYVPEHQKIGGLKPAVDDLRFPAGPTTAEA